MLCIKGLERNKLELLLTYIHINTYYDSAKCISSFILYIYMYEYNII